MATLRLQLVMLAALAGCTTAPAQPVGELKGGAEDGSPSAQALFDADAHTPGFFRDMYRLLSAQSLLDDAVAVERLLLELPARAQSPGELPPLSSLEHDTLTGAMIFAVRALQATQDTPALARTVADEVLSRVLGLDPARRAWNAAHPDATVEVTTAGPAFLAGAARSALFLVAEDAPLLCNSSAATAVWQPGTPEQVWVDEVCLPDTYIEGFCEPDEWVEGDCYEYWVEDDCDGGYWRDDGYYRYTCYGSDCRYVWVARWVYEDGDCYGGHYEEDCSSGYWEDGLCYGGYWQEGLCEPGHFESTYPNGTWSYAAVSAPTDCAAIRPEQYAIALSGVEVLLGVLAEELEPEWAAAALEILEAGAALEPTEGKLAALLAVLDAVTD